MNPTAEPESTADSKVRILLVDDQPASLMALEAILQDLDAELVLANSGEEALKQVLDTDFAVIVMDVRLTGIDGYETARLIRSRDRSKHTPIIFVTAYDTTDLVVMQAYKDGAADHLVKPVAPTILRAKVTGYLELHQKREEMRRQAEVMRELERSNFEYRISVERHRWDSLKLIEQSLRESEERFRLLVEGTKDHAIYMLDRDGRVVSWNPGAERIKGYRAEEVLGQHFRRFYPPEDIAEGKPEQELEIAAADGRCEDEGWRLRKDGSRFWASAVITALYDDSGQLRGYSKITRDMTERRQAEENARRLFREEAARRAAESSAHEARAQREQLRVTLSSIGDGVIVTDAEGRITLLNPIAAALTGWSEAAALGRPLEDVFNLLSEVTGEPVEPPSTHVLRKAIMVGPGDTSILVGKDGTRRHVEPSAAPILSPQGQITGVVLVFRNVSERVRAQQQARFLAEVGKSLAVLVDEESTLQTLARLAVPDFADWCAVDLFGDDGAIGRMAAAHADHAKTPLVHELEQVDPVEADVPLSPFRVIHTGASELQVEVSDAELAQAARDENHLRILRTVGLKSRICVPLIRRNQPVGAITFVTAQSSRRYDAQDLVLAQDLAHRASIALENARLYNEVCEADRRKHEFLAMLAHELRNPLAPLRNALELVRARNLGDQTTERAHEIMQRQVHLMVRLVDDLLDVSRIMRGNIELRKELVDVAAVVTRAVETAQPIIDTHGHELCLELPAEPQWLEADPIRLAQVIANLLHNAAKYTEPGGRIVLAAGREADELVLRVRDTGIGIAAEMLAEIFEPFVQVRDPSDRAGGGMGIGLTLVRQLVELHGGRVQARSDGPGRGSQFEVWLPATSARPRETGSHSHTDQRVILAANPRRILVVDDNIDAAESLAAILRQQGHDVLVAYNGVDALAHAEQVPLDLVLLDIGMPGMSGHEVARRMRQQAGRHGLTLVALTGWGQDDDRRRSREAGFDHHLVKPIDPSELEKLLMDRQTSVPPCPASFAAEETMAEGH